MDKNQTNLTWVDTTKEHCYEINRWSDKNELKVKTEASFAAVEKLNHFLNASPENGLGVFLMRYIKKQPDDYFYNDTPVNLNDRNSVEYVVKTAMHKAEVVGFLAFSHKFEPNTGQDEYHILMYAVNPELQGRGYATAMFRDIQQNPQLIFGVDSCKVTMMVDVDNIACRKVISKFGAVVDEEKMQRTIAALQGRKPKMDEFVMYVYRRQISEIIDSVVAEHNLKNGATTSTLPTTPTTPTTPTDGRKK